MFAAHRAARAAEGLRDRGEEPRDSVHDAVLRAVVRAHLLVRVRQGRAEPLDDAAAGILWIAIAFAGTLALGRTFERERYGETLRALLLAPAPRAGDLRRQAARHRAAAAAGRSCCSCRWSRCCSRRRFRETAAARGAAVPRHARLCRRRHAVRGDAGAGADARRAAADPVVSDHRSGHHCRRARHVGAAAVAAGRAGRDHVDRVAGRASMSCS